MVIGNKLNKDILVHIGKMIRSQLDTHHQATPVMISSDHSCITSSSHASYDLIRSQLDTHHQATPVMISSDHSWTHIKPCQLWSDQITAGHTSSHASYDLIRSQLHHIIKPRQLWSHQITAGHTSSHASYDLIRSQLHHIIKPRQFAWQTNYETNISDSSHS